MIVGCIYVLVDPRDGEIRYVGWTHRALRQRLAEHMYLRANEHNHRVHWLAQLKCLRLKPFIRPLQAVSLTEMEAAERYWINYFRAAGCPLVNNTDGGEGAVGREVSAETRAKISSTKKSKQARLSPERRSQISAQMKGRIVSLETRAKLSAFMKQRVLGAESHAKRAATLRGRSVPAERRERISASLKGLKRSDAYREKQRAAQQKRYQDPAERLRQGTQQQGHAVTEETRQKLRAFWANKRRAT